MAGLWQLSLTQRVDANGRPYPGAKAFFHAAETSDPVTVYAEYSLATPLPNPVIADGNGMFPAVYLDDATSQFYRVRVSDADGVSLIDLTTLPILGIGAGGEGGGDASAPVEATAVFATGDIKIRYDTSQITGWRICNGQTIGSAISGASYANDAAQALFEYLWNKDAELAVVGGRGANAAADWAANKRLTLPDYRGYALVGRDAMGNSAANRVAELVDLSDRTGAASVALTLAQAPAHDHGGATAAGGAHRHFAIANEDNGNTTVVTDTNRVRLRLDNDADEAYRLRGSSLEATIGLTSEAAAHTHTVTSAGEGEAHPNVQPSAGVTVYIKL